MSGVKMLGTMFLLRKDRKKPSQMHSQNSISPLFRTKTNRGIMIDLQGTGK